MPTPTRARSGLRSGRTCKRAPAGLRSIVGALKNECPEAETISGWRTSGASCYHPTRAMRMPASGLGRTDLNRSNWVCQSLF
jgi:hypothetical protein